MIELQGELYWWLTHFPSPPAPSFPKIKQFSCVMNCICYQVAWKLRGPKHLPSPHFLFGIMMSFAAISLIYVFQGYLYKGKMQKRMELQNNFTYGGKLQSILNYPEDGFLANGLSNSLHQILLSGL